MRIYIIRHADPDYPNHTITAAGHLEAKALAQRLKSEGLTRIFVSPLGRALHTMQYTTDILGMDYTIEDWVQEIGGMAIEDETGKRQAAWNAHGELIRRRPLPTSDNWNTRAPLDNPEFTSIFEALKRNSDTFLANLGYVRQEGAYRIAEPNSDRIAVFCHAGFGLTWIAHLLDIPLPLVWSGFFLAPSSVTTVLFDERTDKYAVPRCLAVGDTSHLHAAGLPIQPSGIVANFQ